MKKMNKKGSTLITGIIVVMILLIITGTALSIAYSYHKRSLNEYSRKQAYLNAVGVADVVAKEIYENNQQRLIPTSTTDKKEISSVILPEGTNGDVRGEVVLDSQNPNILYIQIYSDVNHQKEEIQLVMKQQEGKWYKVAYSKIGETFE